MLHKICIDSVTRITIDTSVVQSNVALQSKVKLHFTAGIFTSDSLSLIKKKGQESDEIE